MKRSSAITLFAGILLTIPFCATGKKEPPAPLQSPAEREGAGEVPAAGPEKGAAPSPASAVDEGKKSSGGLPASMEKDPDTLYREGLKFLKAGEEERARDSFLEVVKLRSDFHAAHYNLGVFYLKMDDDYDALKHFRKAVALKPDFTEAWANLGAVQLKQKLYTDALLSLRKAVELNGDDMTSRINLILALTELRRYDEALKEGVKALKKDEKNVDLHLAISLVHLKKGDLKMGKMILTRALGRFPLAKNYPAIYNNIGFIDLQEGDDLNAAGNFLKALELDPNFVDAIINLSSIYIENFNYDEAIKLLERGAALEPLRKDLLINLGVAYLKKGDARHALETYQKVLKMEPENRHALLNIGILYNDLIKDYSTAIKYFEQFLRIWGKTIEEDHSIFKYLDEARNSLSIEKEKEKMKKEEERRKKEKGGKGGGVQMEGAGEGEGVEGPDSGGEGEEPGSPEREPSEETPSEVVPAVEGEGGESEGVE